MLALLIAQVMIWQPTLPPNTVMHCGSLAHPMASLTCETGETLTYTRSTTGTSCPSTDENTSYTVQAIDVPCFSNGYVSVPSLTNSLKRSEDFTHADWIDVGTAPTRAAGVADSPLNGADSDTLADSIVTSAGTQDGLSQQYSASTSGRQRVSVWVKVAAGTLAYSLCVKSGTNTCNTGNGCCQNGVATTTWARALLNTTIGATAQTASFVIVTGNDGTPTAGTLILFGASGSATGALAGGAPYCPSTGAAATTCSPTRLSAHGGNFNYNIGGMTITILPYWYTPDALSASSIMMAYIAANGLGTNSANSRRLHADSSHGLYFESIDNAGTRSFTGSASGVTWTPSVAKTLELGWGGKITEWADGVNKVRTTDLNVPTVAADTLLIGGGYASNVLGMVQEFVLYRVPPGNRR